MIEEKEAICISSQSIIVLAGATGDLGGRIARELVKQPNVRVKALVRHSTTADKLKKLHQLGVDIIAVDYYQHHDLIAACQGADSVVSALSGLYTDVVETQSRLLDAAVKAGVPRFIPSDYSMDYRYLPDGSNRNLDLRRQFMQRLDAAPIQATSILNGVFADILTGTAPLVLFPIHRVLYWQDADQPMDFTTMDDIAAFTARAALDEQAPRFLHIAGDQVNARQLASVMEQLTGKRHRLLRGGSLKSLRRLIAIMRRVAPQPNELYPAWQGMQYFDGMFSGLGKLERLDNDRYPDLEWTSVQQVLAAHLEK
ncbi:aromatic alcohol reductase [Paenibacillus kandeliae]|uniref:aromatic alcohol reductase n=1 Tax=Paenibacillus kandeliae TaxID=3231269 RepID=UPI00345A9DD7